MLNRFSHIQLFSTPCAIVLWAPLFMEFSGQEYWCVLPFPSPGDLPNSGFEPASLTPCTAAYQAPPSMDFPDKSTGVGCHCLLHLEGIVSNKTITTKNSPPCSKFYFLFTTCIEFLLYLLIHRFIMKRKT